MKRAWNVGEYVSVPEIVLTVMAPPDGRRVHVLSSTFPIGDDDSFLSAGPVRAVIVEKKVERTARKTSTWITIERV